MGGPDENGAESRENAPSPVVSKASEVASDSHAESFELEPTRTFVGESPEPLWDRTPKPAAVLRSDNSKSDRPKTVGRYEIRRILGKGGFGAVYLGYDPQLNREVAIKVPHFGKSERDVELDFLQEARQLAQLKHPGIVTVYDVGIDNGRCYIVSDFLSGQSLSEWLRENKPTWQEAARISAALADALAHAQRTVHRDLKPGNVILRDGRHPVLVDFGLAVSDAPSVTQQPGSVSGTPSYMSPEQARGAGHRIDGRTDIYSLGVILYRTLTGVLPFRATNVVELLRQVCDDEPQPPRQLVPDLPRELEQICLKALAKKIANRYTTASDMADDLRRVALQCDPASQVSNAPSTASATLHTSALTNPSFSDSASSETNSSLRRAREAERRHVTVMICSCDVFDSDEILESLDEEERHEALVDFQDACTKAVEEFDGTVVQRTDHGLMACFGFPLAFEDAAQRAVHSALKVLQEMTAINERWRRHKGVTLTSKLAIHSGLAVVEDSGGADSLSSLSITGQVRNVAAKLEFIADPLNRDTRLRRQRSRAGLHPSPRDLPASQRS